MNLRDIIDKSNSILIVSGAGVSTASGLPDFRSQEGLYSYDDDPTKILSRSYYNKHPEATIKYIVDNFVVDKNTEPNLGHQFAYDLYKTGKLVGVVTQNVDHLYQKTQLDDAYIVEIHGNANNFICTNCKNVISRAQVNDQYHSTCCNAIVDTEVILYGDNFHSDAYHRYINMLNKADLVIVMGTTLQITAHLFNISNIETKILINNEKIAQPYTTMIDYNYIGDINTTLKNEYYKYK